mmetsp:Transcript_5374/g.9383  ORF Transcript_5374/g.9383 Transcript_5374/m.9383 type:complete len:95 (+) Transcript_5374:75-359(+)
MLHYLRSALLLDSISSPPRPMLHLLFRNVHMGKISLHTRRMFEAIAAYSPTIIFESVPIQSQLLLCPFVSRKILHAQRLQNIPPPFRVGIGIEE